MIRIEQLHNINLSQLGELVIENEFKGYFLDEPGKEHYKLLSYLSTQFNNTSLLDIGTYKGCSALALSYNQSNKVTSFDIEQGTISLHSRPDNVEFVTDNVLNGSYDDLLLASPLIMLDTAHEGPFEHQFYRYLHQIKWKGTLVVDDIHLNVAMKDFWNSINEEKYDITNIGHHSGTGLVIFK